MTERRQTRRDAKTRHRHSGPTAVAAGRRFVTKERPERAELPARRKRLSMSGLDDLSWERDGRDWPNREASRFVEAGGLRWHVQQMGRGPVLLLLHGTGASTHSWRALLPLLAKSFTVVAPDLPGHGFTATPSGGAFR